MNTPPSEEGNGVTQQAGLPACVDVLERQEPVLFTVSSVIDELGQTPDAAAEVKEVGDDEFVSEENDVFGDISSAAEDDGSSRRLVDDADVGSNVEIQNVEIENVEEETEASRELSVDSDDVELEQSTSRRDGLRRTSELDGSADVSHQSDVDKEATTTTSVDAFGFQASDRYGNIRVTLERKELWLQFNSVGTEMIITKAGRWRQTTQTDQ